MPRGMPSALPPPRLPPASPPARRHMFFCASLAIGLVKSGYVSAISMERETYLRLGGLGEGVWGAAAAGGC